MLQTPVLRRFLPFLAMACACAGEAPDPRGADSEAAADSTPPGALQGRTYERAIVFLTPREDSALVVPWIIEARARPGGVVREARAWLARGGTWEPFFAERWETPPTRAPWRILPRGSMRLVVGLEDALERILFNEGPRQLEVELGPTLAEWSGRRGETVRILEGAALLSSERVEGVIVDLSRAWRRDAPPPGDWAVLASGDSLQVVMAAERPGDPEDAPPYQGWARIDFREVRWPDLQVRWTETRAFERSRRDVPVAWALRSSAGGLEGRLEVLSAHLRPGEGEGPLLPVEGLYGVAGTLDLAGASYPVRGLLRHAQP